MHTTYAPQVHLFDIYEGASVAQWDICRPTREKISPLEMTLLSGKQLEL